MPESLIKQYNSLARNIASFSNGQVKISEDATGDSYDSMKEITLTFSPSSGLYHGGTFKFKICLEDFPFESPDVVCSTPIYHPNIGYDGVVCLNLLDDLWSTTVTLEDIVQGILFLFYNPVIEDPLSEIFDGAETYKDYKSNVRLSLRGNDVAGFSFKRNLPEDFQSDVEVEKEEDKVVKKNIHQGSEYEGIDSYCDRNDVGYSSLNELNSGENEINRCPILLRSHSSKSSSEDISTCASNLGQSPLVHPLASPLFIPASLFGYGVTFLSRVGIFVTSSLFGYGLTFLNRFGIFIISRFNFWLSRTRE